RELRAAGKGRCYQPAEAADRAGSRGPGSSLAAGGPESEAGARRTFESSAPAAPAQAGRLSQAPARAGHARTASGGADRRRVLRPPLLGRSAQAGGILSALSTPGGPAEIGALGSRCRAIA